ncbi:helix-turn-helix domain-containing protein [Actinomycetospora chibensis]|uniref:Helix-turn-helix domain-containing protein n=1 Tax=Actinomycetospora chibensis TaxID=663606 RepID=A0ABV9RDA0_9PSEU|nr:helix-turn-helix domain-containing protein [Actinomycetospora chibensis]MDD7925024.1 helix-turn-helix domain-containing protein [Actinomycetospora chibensis]
MTAHDSSPRLFLTVTETASALRVDPATIYRAIRAGTFPAVRVRGRYVVPARAVDELATRAVETGACVDVTDVALPQPDARGRTAFQPRPAIPAPTFLKES